MATIQQFLDELVWRESHGLSAEDALRNITRHLSDQTHVDYGMSLIKRLPAVAADPFKDWSIQTNQIAVSTPTGTSLVGMQPNSEKERKVTPIFSQLTVTDTKGKNYPV